jgi:phosphatidate cytidylyltransferase
VSNLLLRVASGVVALPLLVLVVLWRDPRGFAAVGLVAAAIALVEYSALTLPGRPFRERAAVVGVGTALAGLLYARPDLALPAVVGAAILLLGLQLGFTRAEEMATAGARLGVSVTALLYVSSLMMALPLVKRDVPNGELWVLLAMGATFSCDTGAYFVGRAFGRRKLAPAISPGKTWAGIWGGLGGALAFTFVARATFFKGLETGDALAVGFATSVLAPAGDLVESLLKRSAGVKDSGALIPGHGGMLDRLDALLFVGGFVYVYTAVVR